tara:strand:+ start:270 stop:578 length:309 start_codon:yes stop_codon:yes gene_type:complete
MNLFILILFIFYTESFILPSTRLISFKLNDLEKHHEIYKKFEEYSNKQDLVKQREYLIKIAKYLKVKKYFSEYEQELLNDNFNDDCPICKIINCDDEHIHYF